MLFIELFPICKLNAEYDLHSSTRMCLLVALLKRHGHAESLSDYIRFKNLLAVCSFKFLEVKNQSQIKLSANQTGIKLN